MPAITTNADSAKIASNPENLKRVVLNFSEEIILKSRLKSSKISGRSINKNIYR